MRHFLFASLVLAAASTATAQDEASLRQFFEGMTVTVKLDMPGTSDGVEIRPTASMPLDTRKLAISLKSNGVGVHEGDRIMVTKVVVKEHHIEFHLGGGGFGTFSDLMSLPTAPAVPYETKSRYEKDLENELKWADSWRRDEIRRELADLRRERNRDNSYNAAANVQAQEERAAMERDARAQGGSRFNIRYDQGLPPGALTPEGLMEALSAYIEFDGGGSDTPAQGAPDPGSGMGTAIRKGMTIAQVEQVLGPADNVQKRTEGTIQVTLREYATEDGQRVSAKFAGGVLIDYSITPRQ